MKIIPSFNLEGVDGNSVLMINRSAKSDAYGRDRVVLLDVTDGLPDVLPDAFSAFINADLRPVSPDDLTPIIPDNVLYLGAPDFYACKIYHNMIYFVYFSIKLHVFTIKSKYDKKVIEKKATTSHQEMKKQGILKVLKALRNNAINRQEIVEQTGLSWGSCFNNINFLMEKEILVSETDTSTSGRGRKMHAYRFNDGKYLLFGMEPRSSEVLCSISNFGGEEIYRSVFPLNDPLNIDNLHRSLNAAFIHSLIGAELKPDKILGMSLAVAGGVDTRNMIWTHSPRIGGVDHFDFRSFFSMLPDIRFHVVEHDIHAQASSVMNANGWSENSYAFVHLGRGVSTSVYHDGLITGYRGFAGEIGHIPFTGYPGGALSDAGENVESYISLKGMLQYINTEFHEMFQRFEDVPVRILHDGKVRDHVERVVVYIMHVLANLFDPKVIIAGGPSIEPFLDQLSERIPGALRKLAWAGGPEEVRWYKNEDMFGAYGTALNARDKIMDPFLTGLLDENES